MKIILISNVMPTPDNYRAGSAHPYHLIKYRPDDVEIEMYSFNANRVNQDNIERISKELRITVKLVPKTRWISLLFKFHLGYIKNFLPYPFEYYMTRLRKEVVNEINTKNPDGIWIWGDGSSYILKQFPSYKRVLSMPDSVALYYHRLLGDKYFFKSFYGIVGSSIQYYKQLKQEGEYPSDKNVHCHLVGEADKDFLKRINPQLDARFIRHPHYNIIHNKIIKFSQPKIKILIAGQYNLYMKTAFDDILPALCKHKEFTQYYSITFLGKGWDFAVEKLKALGYESQRLGFVDVYVDEIIKYDIQLTPISVGTGTKGKVLDAIANGLLVLGTPYAMENIAVENGKSCVVYNNPQELIQTLNNIYQNVFDYERMAEQGRESVVKYHSRSSVSKELFDLFK